MALQLKLPEIPKIALGSFDSEVKQLIDSMHKNTPKPDIELINKAFDFLKVLDIRTLPKRMRGSGDFNLIKKAYSFSKEKHGAQKRASGEPYFSHLMQTALILSEYGVDSETIAAALLHDVLEDTDVDRKELEKIFGPAIGSLVEGVTKLDVEPEKKDEKYHLNYVQQVILASQKDIRVLLIKLADKLHNLRTIDFLPPEKRKKTARLALDVFVPLANRLGMRRMQREMEDICFKVLYPEEFELLLAKIGEKRRLKIKDIEKMKPVLAEKFMAKKLQISFDQRMKSIYSFYRKMKTQGKSLDEIHDYAVLVVLAENIGDCYNALGVINTTFYPLPGKFKDFIATPTNPTYQSIHVTVVGPSGEPVKIYIRTKRMHELARKGVTVWLKDKGKMHEYIQQWHNLEDLSKSEFLDEGIFFNALKSDFLEQQIFVFTGKGAMVNLPSGSTPVDFAFKTGPETAAKLIEAKANGRIVPLWYSLASGDIVEIISGKHLTAKKEWLDFAKSHYAREKISKALKLRKKSGRQSGQRISIHVRAKDRIGLFSDIANVFAKNRISLESVQIVNEPEAKMISDYFMVRVKNRKHLEKILKKLQKVKNVIEAAAR